MPEGGWQSRRAYPLLLSFETEMAVTRYRSEKNLSMGKALNELLKLGLYSTGFMLDPSKCQHEYEVQRKAGQILSVCKVCKSLERSVVEVAPTA